MAGFRKFQQTSYITHEVSIAVEVCTHLPCLFTQDLLMHQHMMTMHNARPRVPQAQRHYSSGGGGQNKVCIQFFDAAQCFVFYGSHHFSFSSSYYVAPGLLSTFFWNKGIIKFVNSRTV